MPPPQPSPHPNPSEGLLGNVSFQAPNERPRFPFPIQDARAAAGQSKVEGSRIGDHLAAELRLEETQPLPWMAGHGVRRRDPPQVEVAAAGLRGGGDRRPPREVVA